MSAADRRAFAYALGRFTASRETFDARAVASVAGMLADRRARCERFERRMKTGRGSFARRLARMTAGPAAVARWTAWRPLEAGDAVRMLDGALAVVMDGMAFYPDRTEYWTTE